MFGGGGAFFLLLCCAHHDDGDSLGINDDLVFFVPMPCALEAQTVIKTFCL